MTEDELIEQYQDYDDAEPTPRAFCDNYTSHEAHVYGAINGCFYSCPGMTAEQVSDLADYEASVGKCEHGMREDLCEGPNHYQSYDDEKRSAQ